MKVTFCNIILIVFIIMVFFFNDTATTEIYTLSLHDALPISRHDRGDLPQPIDVDDVGHHSRSSCARSRSEEHTSELQSHVNLVCRLLLEKKKNHYFYSSVVIIKTNTL